jgi:glycosyltransferase involved in cell wall biosynthesis
MPLVDIVMPVFNAGRYLDEAVRSLQRQTLADFRLILVNDGSTDGSGERCHAFAAADPRLLCLDQENRGITRSLNRGLDLATAPFVARMDADDIAEPDRLAQQLRYLESHPAVVALGTSVHSIDDRGALVNRFDPPALHADIDRELLTGNGGAMIHPSLLFRRDTLRAIGGYTEELPYSQDLDIFLRLAEVGRLANLLSPLLRYRLHPGASNFTHGTKKRELKEGILRRAAARRGVPFVPPPVRPLLHERDAATTLREWALYASAHQQRRAAVRHLAAAVVHRPLARDNLRAARVILPRLFRRPSSEYWTHRQEMNYYLEVRRLAAEHAASAASVLEVGPRNTAFLRRLDWIPDKTAIDIAFQPEIPGVRGFKGDFFAFDPGRRFDLVLCLQVLEHLDDPAAFARKLLATGRLVIASVPYRWPAGMCQYHKQDPIDETKLLGWFGRAPRDWIRVTDERLDRIICVYDAAPARP